MSFAIGLRVPAFLVSERPPTNLRDSWAHPEIIFKNSDLHLGNPQSSRPGAIGPKSTGTGTTFTWGVDGQSAMRKGSSGLVSEYWFISLQGKPLGLIEYKNGEMLTQKGE